MRSIVLTIAILTTFTQAARAGEPCSAGKRSLLILGTFHMQPSGEDAVNTRSDMTTPERQRELAALVDALARYRPTKVAIESARNSTVWNDRYQQWLAGTRPLGTNEIEQVAFRLVRKAGLPGVTPVDFPMWMNGLTPIERHEPRKSEPPPSSSTPADESAKLEEIRAQVAADGAHLATHTVAEHLAYLNEPRRAAMNHRWDVLSNLTPGAGVALYENADLVSNWYKRNARIFTNLLDASGPGDRILLVIGAGHVAILGDWAAEHPDVCRVRAAEFLQSQ